MFRLPLSVFRFFLPPANVKELTLENLALRQQLAVMSQHHQDKQHSKCRRGHGEEIKGGQILNMVIEKGSPGLGGSLQRLGISRETVRSETAIPNFSNSP